jgi:hypothetical protein
MISSFVAAEDKDEDDGCDDTSIQESEASDLMPAAPDDRG